jgi:hypothetical protein
MTNEITRNPDYLQTLQAIKQHIQQGFSRTSLFAMRQLYVFFSPRFEFVPQSVGQIKMS